uniref:TSA: Wollemia nobilis Ref_Wollemi_Transcript_26507_964 transcribed RNA sequence n=1 Tax=Wollemia nobilis TaxID=56998 RepID=A0A0C9RQ02_9CONI
MASHFVLVHGAMHGAWCWYKILHLLHQHGHRVTAVDLTSAGTSPVPAESVGSFEEYNRPLFHLLSNLPSTEKVVLVGHSFGGVSLTVASEAFPHKIAVAVYVCALMNSDVENYNNTMKSLQSGTETTKQSQYHFGDGPDQPPTSTYLPKEFQRDRFYGTSPSWDVALASLLLRPFPMKGFQGIEVKTTKERYGSVPKVYIKTERDNVISIELQEEMIGASPPEEVYILDCDHSPFFSEPEQLHRLLLEIAAKYK